MGLLIIGIIWCITWGIVVNKVIENKGYEENWFWWGFFFGIFALIVALTKQNVHATKTTVETTIQNDVAQISSLSTNAISADKVDINSAVHIVSWKIQKENQTNRLLQIEFANVTESVITAVMFSVTGFNSFGDKVFVEEKESFHIIGQDFSIKPGAHANLQKVLPNAEIQKVNITVKKVCFSDGTIEEHAASKWIDTNQNPLPAKYLDCVKRKNSRGKFYAIVEENYWQCVCGFVNTGNDCKSCRMQKAIASGYTEGSMGDTYQVYLKELKEREAEGIEQQKKDKACIRTLMFLGIILVVIVLGVLIFEKVENEKRLEEERIEIAERYKEEKIAISEYIEKNEYDKAYSVMIASDSYDKLKDEYGSVLWEKQIELDKEFVKKSIVTANNKDEMIYDEKRARDGLCYYVMYKLGGTYLYAVEENGNKYIIFSHSGQEGLSFDGFSRSWYGGKWKRNEDRFGQASAAWSNGWLIVGTFRLGDGLAKYAIKYDVEEQREYVVELEGIDERSHTYFKMRDGNILMSGRIDDNINDMQEDDLIKFFNVVDGTIKELSYDEVQEMYDDIEENVLFIVD